MNIQRWMNKRIGKNERGEESGGRVIGQMNFQRWMNKRIEKNERGEESGGGGAGERSNRKSCFRWA